MMPARPITDVLRDHTPALMKLEGVVGVYEGATPGGKACIVVMIGTETPAPREDVPKEIEGYPVRLEFGGPIRPLR